MAQMPQESVPANKKTKIKRVLKSAALLPVTGVKHVARVPFKPGKGSGRGAFAPQQGEPPLVIFRVQVVGCMGLLAKDRSGTSDPFVAVSILNKRQTTPKAKKTLNPLYSPSEATFDFPLYLSLADRVGALELVVWDKDMIRKDYLGEVALPLEDWFFDRARDKERAFGFGQPGNEAISINLVSTRANTPGTGSIQIKIGFVPTPNSQNLMEFDEIFSELVKRSRPSLVSAPPTEGFGTIRSNVPGGPQFEDDGGISSESEGSEEEDGEEEDEIETEPNTPASQQSSTRIAAPPIQAPPYLGSISLPTTTSPSRSPPLSGPITTTSDTHPLHHVVSPLKSSKPPQLPIPEFNVHVSEASPSTPTPGNMPTPVVSSSSVVGTTSAFPPSLGHVTPEATPKASGFPLSKIVRKFSSRSGVTPASPALASPGVDAHGNIVLLPISDGEGERDKKEVKEKEKEKKDKERKKFGRSWSGNTTTSSSSQASGMSASAGGGTSVTMMSGSRSGTVSGASSPGLEVNDPVALTAPVGSGVGVIVAGVSPSGAGGVVPTGGGAGADKTKRKKRKKKEFEFNHANDIVGIVMLDIRGAEDLPKLSNMTRTGWDMDPFVVISFAKKVFRTRVVRHTLNPTWDEKLLFHVRRYETSFNVHFSILDWDKLSSNDLIAETSMDLGMLVGKQAEEEKDERTGIYKSVLDAPVRPQGDTTGMVEGQKGLEEFTLELKGQKGFSIWDGRHKPVLRVKAKYQPYDALRQRFWRQYLKQYDTDDTDTYSHLELTSMLDSLGSTLTRSTINSFFTRWNKDPKYDELTLGETIRCLEDELGKEEGERRKVGEEDPSEALSASATPLLMLSDHRGEELQLDKLDFSGPQHVNHPTTGGETEGTNIPLVDAARGASVSGSDLDMVEGEEEEEEEENEEETEGSSGSGVGTPVEVPGGGGLVPTAALGAEVPKKKRMRFKGIQRKKKKNAVDATATTTTSSSPDPSSAGSTERIINVKNCPLCHRPRLNSKAEVDIITHLAVCASGDWGKVDRIMVGNFVTASQAQRKWYTKVLSKVSSGTYRLGANSANIIVQNRMTGQLEEEKMQVYVRLGIRLLYKGATGRMEGGKARSLLKSLSIKQGIKYDAPESAKDIPGFIEFHGLNVDEILDPIPSFKTFNEFFYRKLKPSARPVESLEDPHRAVSAADCRFMAFETVNDATRLWIKGREFTVERLLGDAYKGVADKYHGGALCIFRLAPQDYHRFHSPVDGVVGEMTYISGEYYTVNPQAIRTSLDVYGENARKIVPIHSPQFGTVMAVCIGAMMVGTIQTTVTTGQSIKRGDEFGYFAFGGSTIVVLFEKGRVTWDEDLVINGRACLETLVRVGMGIGRGVSPGGSDA